MASTYPGMHNSGLKGHGGSLAGRRCVDSSIEYHVQTPYNSLLQETSQINQVSVGA